MNIGETLLVGRERLAASANPALDARLLLEHILQTNHAFLAGHREQELTAEQEGQYTALLERAQRREPIPYLIGHAPFYGREFVVTPAVLIPRPETEQLVETALAWAIQRPGEARRVVDVGTGSGCVAVTLALHLLPEVVIVATDVSADALAVARQNAERHKVADRIQFTQGYLLLDSLATYDLIVANLPYVSDEEWQALDDGVKWYEPVVALRGGADGFDLIRQLLEQARPRLKAGGAIFLEIGWRQGPAARAIAQSYFPLAQVEIKQDYAGHDRILMICT